MNPSSKVVRADIHRWESDYTENYVLVFVLFFRHDQIILGFKLGLQKDRLDIRRVNKCVTVSWNLVCVLLCTQFLFTLILNELSYFLSLSLSRRRHKQHLNWATPVTDSRRRSFLPQSANTVFPPNVLWPLIHRCLSVSVEPVFWIWWPPCKLWLKCTVCESRGPR